MISIRAFASYLFVVFCFSTIGCEVSNTVSEGRNRIVNRANSVQRYQKHKEKIDIDLVMGCWSSSNGSRLRIDKDMIRTSVNGFEPIKYVPDTVGTDENILLLKLIDRPHAYFFRAFVSLEIGEDEYGSEQLTIRDYESKDDFDLKKSSGISTWIKDECTKAYPKAQEKE